MCILPFLQILYVQHETDYLEKFLNTTKKKHSKCRTGKTGINEQYMLHSLSSCKRWLQLENPVNAVFKKR